MVFSTIIFLCVFLPIVIIGYYLVPKPAKNMFLLICSLFFYAWGEPVYVLIMLASIAYNYLFGMFIANTRQDKLWMIISVVVNLLVLGVFKYSGFFIENIDKVIPNLLHVPDIALPIGISFYTFQGMSYCIDVYRDKEMVQKNPVNLALYIAMFPQLIAGPIVRYSNIRTELTGRSHNAEMFSEGAGRFIIGLSKKAILANTLGAVATNIMSEDLQTMGAGVAVPYFIRYRFTSIFQDILIWQSDWAKSLVSISQKTLTIRIFQNPSGNSGADGIFPYPAGLGTISIFRLEEAEEGMCICIF